MRSRFDPNHLPKSPQSFTGKPRALDKGVDSLEDTVGGKGGKGYAGQSRGEEAKFLRGKEFKHRRIKPVSFTRYRKGLMVLFLTNKK